MRDNLERYNQCLLFKVLGDPPNDLDKWTIQPKPRTYTIPRGEALWLTRTHAVGGDKDKRYFLLIRTPERHWEGLIILSLKGGLERVDPAETPFELVPMLACEHYGPWEQYLSKSRPELGVEVLEPGLVTAKRKGPVARDLARVAGEAGKLDVAVKAIAEALKSDDLDDRNALIELRAKWLHALGKDAEAEADERDLQRAAAKKRNARKVHLTDALKASPSPETLSEYIEAGFPFPKDARLLTSLLGITEEDRLLIPVLKALRELLGTEKAPNPRLLSQRLDALLLRISDGPAHEAARSLKDAL